MPPIETPASVLRAMKMRGEAAVHRLRAGDVRNVRVLDRPLALALPMLLVGVLCALQAIELVALRAVEVALLLQAMQPTFGAPAHALVNAQVVLGVLPSDVALQVAADAVAPPDAA